MPVPANLKRLQCKNTVLTLELVEWLGKLPNLNWLRLSSLSPGVEGLPAASLPSRFLSLNTLRIEFMEAMITRALHNQSSGQVFQSFVSVAENCPKLGLITIIGDAHTHLGWSNTLKSLPVRSLYLVNYKSHVWTLANASQAIKSWNEFGGLRIEQSTHPIEDLGDILPFHPNLTALKVELRGDTWTNVSTRPVPLEDGIYQPLSLTSSFTFCKDYTDDQLNDLAR
ncbi:hypothetical protein FRC07_005459 [Ceratobasidium sp. 392]|nr:hypothetical protein FRC07_005459 [Ceratobasidium sp. 392]